MSSEMEDYLFDLRGYIVIPNAIDKSLIDKINQLVNRYVLLETNQWKGYVHHRSKNEIQNIMEAGDPFEHLIDHASYIDHLTRYVGGDDGLFIDEAFVNVRESGGSTPLHSGAHKRRIRTQFRFHNNQFRCGQINMLLALNDIGSGDGATMVIPSSHKSNLLHPSFQSPQTRSSLEEVAGAIEVHLQAGDVLLFVDCMAHGSAIKRTLGERRILIYRYGPHWGHNRYGYQSSEELLARLTPARRRIVCPISPLGPP